MDTLTLIQLLGAGLALWSMWLMGNETLWGPTVSFIASFPYLYVSYCVHTWAFAACTIIIMLVDGRNFVKWWREGIRWHCHK